MNPQLNVTLQLSGTPLTGYRHVVPRAWAMGTTREHLAISMKNSLYDFCNMNNLIEMTELLRTTNLHVHHEYENNASIIYICNCE